MKDITGRRVKLKRAAKRYIGRSAYREFAGKIGVAQPFEYPPGNRWPEWDVYWDLGDGHTLHYLYKREHLAVLP